MSSSRRLFSVVFFLVVSSCGANWEGNLPGNGSTGATSQNLTPASEAARIAHFEQVAPVLALSKFTLRFENLDLGDSSIEVLLNEQATQIDEVKENTVTFRVPLGAQTGPIQVRVGELVIESEEELLVATSVSGKIVYGGERTPLALATIHVSGAPHLSTQSDEDGIFVLPTPVPGLYLVEVAPPQMTTPLTLPAVTLKLYVRQGRDNPVLSPIHFGNLGTEQSDSGAGEE